MLTPPKPVTRVGMRHREPGERRGEHRREDALRAVLVENPNDREAFSELADLVRKRAVGVAPADPLRAEALPADARRASDLAVWALAEELAGNPRGWFPLIELGRLSLADDHEGAMRRLHGACERENTGLAVAEAISMLRDAGMPGEAISVGVGHWDPKEHVSEAGRQLVLAALEADRPLDARRHLRELAEAHGDDAEVGAVVADLERQVAAAEAAVVRDDHGV